VREPRRLLLPVAAVAALLGVIGGIGRSGLLPVPPQVSISHELLMTVAVLGSLIALERSGPNSPLLVGPLLIAASGLISLVPPASPSAGALAAAGSAVAAASSLRDYGRYGSVALGLIAGGFVALVLSSVLLALGLPVLQVLPLLMCFPLLVIAGERAELTASFQRLRPGGPRTAGWRPAVILLLLAVLTSSLSILRHEVLPAFGAVLTAVGIWLMRGDPAVRAGIGAGGLHRYVAVNTLLGYAWLAASGVFHMAAAALDLPVQIRVHSFYLGFVFHAIVAHAPLILPALAGIRRPVFTGWLYASTLLLTPSLALRFAGILMGLLAAYKLGVALNAVSIAALAIALVSKALQVRAPT